VEAIEKPSQQGIDDPFRVDAGGPEEYGRQEQKAQTAEGVPAKLLIKYPEQGDLSPEGEKGKEEGIDVKVVEGKDVEQDMRPLDDVVWPIAGVDQVGVAGPKIREAHGQIVSGGKAVLEETPDISMLRIVFIGYQIMQTSRAHL